ncbi:MAG TPA: PGPGW domain-containing protein [Pseudonocardiaceae bacterium]
MGVGRSLKRVLVAVAGALLLVVGVVLLVLPGPGLLLVLAGLLILASEFPAVERYVEPVRTRAMQGAEQSVATPWRIAGSATVGVLLVAAGVVWGLVPWLPLHGWSTGSSLMLSGVVVFALLIWSYRRVRARRR